MRSNESFVTAKASKPQGFRGLLAIMVNGEQPQKTTRSNF
jgi:hypothetical protein